MTKSKKQGCLLLSALMFGLSACSNHTTRAETSSLDDTEINAMTAEANQLANQFGGALLSTVQAAVAQGGTEAGITVCQAVAPALAQNASRAGWHVGRTSLKLRNMRNHPDAWERDVLEQFEAAQRVNPQQIPQPVRAVINGEFRFMKPIVMGQPCLACHGTSLSATTQAALKRHYPEDQATGYPAGQLRGAFTLRKPVNQTILRSQNP